MPELHSSIPHIVDVANVALGKKPAALVDDYAGTLAHNMGLVTQKVPPGSFGTLLSKKLTNVVCREPDSCKRVLDILKKYPIPRPAEYHREMGKALGYPEEDIDYFLQLFCSCPAEKEKRS